MMQLPESQDDSQYQDERRNLSLLDAWKFQFAISELTQQDGRGKKTANLLWQAWR